MKKLPEWLRIFLAIVVGLAMCWLAVDLEQRLTNKRRFEPAVKMMEGAAACAMYAALASAMPPKQPQISVAVATGKYEDPGERHPELRPGERFETNCAIEEFGRIPYKTKRPGKTAYDMDGEAFKSLAGRRYIPVFIKTEEWKAVREMAKGNKFPLHFWTRNNFFANATVTMIGVERCISDGREVKKTFRLKREKSLGKSWENQLIVPTDFCLLELIVKPRGKKAIKFMLYKKMEEGNKVNILLSSLPQPEFYTRPRLNVIKSYKNDYRWSTTYKYKSQSINQNQMMFQSQSIMAH